MSRDSSRDRASLATRLRCIQGHLQAVERLVACGRLVEAAVQLRAVRGATAQVAVEVCRGAIALSPAQRPRSAAAGDLLAMAHLLAAQVSHRGPRAGRLQGPRHLLTAAPIKDPLTTRRTDAIRVEIAC
jgi:DNA-binding FrmR family transcriptional regulator